MAQASFESGSAPFLNSTEQNLLMNALKSNQTKSKDTPPDDAINAPTDINIFDSLNDSSFLDGHFDSTNFNWDLDPTSLGEHDNGQDSSHSADGEDASSSDQTGDKRKDRDDDDSGSPEDVGSHKRRDSEEKAAKKPGRKPLTNEPTSKRKAQNRAAQRAFRERKEKHLRDLEQKVEDLEKASEATNHENGVLRAQVDRLQAELSAYKKSIETSRPAAYSPSQPVNKMNWDISQSFDFEFPKFGVENSVANKTNECVQSINALHAMEKQDAERDFFRSSNSFTWSPSTLTNTRSMSTSTGASNYFDTNNTSPVTTARSPTTNTDKSVCNSESPASLGMGSSVCTTPETYADSPSNFKSTDKKNSLARSDLRASASPSQPKTPAQDNLQALDWFTNQNNGLFDPILIDAYREPQDNILSNADLNLSFFDDAFPWNPASNYSAPFSAGNTDTSIPKKSLLDKVEQAAEGKQHDKFTKNAHASADPGSRQITCAKLWDRVQRSEKVLSGEADMDDLCSQLKAKAKCGGPNKGAVVDERDVDAILGPDPAQKKKNTGMFGMFG